MSKILDQLELAANTNKAEALKLLPELFRTVHEGIIIELPCKVGTIVFTIYEFHCPICKKDHNRIELRQFELPMLLDIGKTVFLTREDAEERLESEK